MKRLSLSQRILFLLVILFPVVLILSFSGNSNGLTVEEIIKLKESGVSDDVIKKLIEQEREKGKPNAIEGKPKTFIAIHNKNDTACLIYRISGESIDVTFVWEESDINYFPGFSIISKSNWSGDFEIRPGTYIIKWYIRNASYEYKREQIEKNLFLRSFSISIGEGDKFDLYFDHKYGFWKGICTLNIFKNSERILRARLEGV